MASSTAPLPVSVLQPASHEAALLAEVSSVAMAVAAVLFVFAMAVLMLALRRRKHPVAPTVWVLGAGVLLPAVVLSGLLVYSTLRAQVLERVPADDALVIGVTAHLWWWELRYRDPATGLHISTANELHLPVGRPVRLALASADVVHSVWVPALGGKMDLVPGRLNRLHITAREPGVHRGQCAEFCGEQHARMALHVVAQAPAEFEAWLAAQARPAAQPHEAQALRGRALFASQGCASCHTVRGQAGGTAPVIGGTSGPVGPDLTHLGSRRYLAAGQWRNEPAALRHWIADAQALKPGARMPSFAHLEPAALDALAAYLAQLE